MRKSTQWIIGLAVSLTALGLAFRSANVAQVAEALRTANYFYVLPAGALIFVGLAARAFSWQSILGYHVPFRRVFAAINAGYLLNNVLPLRLGELARAYLIGRSENMRTTQALSSVVVERVIDLCMIVGLLMGFLPVVVGLPWARDAAAVSILVSILAAAGLIVLVRNPAWAVKIARLALKYLPWLNAARWEARLNAFLAGLAVLQDRRRFVYALLGSILAWIAAGFAAWFLLLGFVPEARLEAGFFVLVVTGLGVAVPSAPASLGVWEAAAVLALSVFKIEGSAALSYAVVLHLTNVGVTSIFGAMALAQEGETLGHLAQAAQSLLASGSAEPAPEADPAQSRPPQPAESAEHRPTAK